MGDYEFIENLGEAPQGAKPVDVGCEIGGQRWLFTGLVETPNGPVGAMINKSTLTAYYAEGGQEKVAKSFKWLVTTKKITLHRHDEAVVKPKGTVKFGKTVGAERDSFATVAIARAGLIPGTAETDTCTFTYKGSVNKTPDYLWLVCE